MLQPAGSAFNLEGFLVELGCTSVVWEHADNMSMTLVEFSKVLMSSKILAIFISLT